MFWVLDVCGLLRYSDNTLFVRRRVWVRQDILVSFYAWSYRKDRENGCFGGKIWTCYPSWCCWGTSIFIRWLGFSEIPTYIFRIQFFNTLIVYLKIPLSVFFLCLFKYMKREFGSVCEGYLIVVLYLSVWFLIDQDSLYQTSTLFPKASRWYSKNLSSGCSHKRASS